MNPLSKRWCTCWTPSNPNLQIKKHKVATFQWSINYCPLSWKGRKKRCSIPFQLPTLLEAQPFFPESFLTNCIFEKPPRCRRQFARIAAVKYSCQCSAVGTNGVSFIADAFFFFFFTIWWLPSSCQKRHIPSLEPNGRERHECCWSSSTQLMVHIGALKPLQRRPNYGAIIFWMIHICTCSKLWN